MLLPQSGTIHISNKKIEYTNKLDLNYVRDKIAIVFQQYNLFQNMNILKNVCIAPYKIKKRNKDEVVDQAINLLDNSYPEELSGGQQQRVAIARALCLNPEILLLDEITSALDPELVKEVLDTIKLLADEGMTMLIVSHEMVFVKELSHKVVFMDQGSIIEIDKPNNIFENPKHERTSNFVSKILKDK